MDFLAAIQKKVQEMEEQARLLQSMETEMGEQQRRQARKQQAKQQKKQKQQRQQPQQNQRSLVSHDEQFQTPDCPTRPDATAGPVAAPAAGGPAPGGR